MTEGLYVPVDLNSVSDDFTPMPEGMYKMQVEKLEPKASKAGNNMINVTMNVLEPVLYLGRKGFTNLVLVPAAMWKVKQYVKATGIEFNASGFNLGDSIGKSMMVKVTQEQYTDKDGNLRLRNTFDEYLPEQA